MLPKDNDTDPSTPGALRTDRPGGAGRPGAAFSPLAHQTDPGVGPPSGALESGCVERVPVRPLGLTMPLGTPSNDSVDVLLDGITGSPSSRMKTMPQTDGQAAASYHVEHPVRPSRATVAQVEKVLVDRPPLATTARLDRAKVQGALSRPEHAQPDMEQTAIRPRALGPRIVVALIAALAVSLGLVVVFELQLQHHGRKAKAGSSAGQAHVTASVATPRPVGSATAGAVPLGGADAVGAPREGTAEHAPSAPGEGSTGEHEKPTGHPAAPSGVALRIVAPTPAAAPMPGQVRAARAAAKGQTAAPSATPSAAPASSTPFNYGDFKTTFH